MSDDVDIERIRREHINRLKAFHRSPEYQAHRAAAMKRLGLTEADTHLILFASVDEDSPAKG